MALIRVLMLLPNLRVSNGVSSYAMSYFRAVDRKKIHMDFALYRDVPSPYYEEIRAAGSRIFILPPFQHPVRHRRSCRKILEEGHYDVVHDNSLMITWPMMRCARRLKVPVRILHSHNSKLGETPAKERRNRFFLPLLLRQATDFAACSPLAAEGMFGNRKYELIPNVIDGNRYRFDGDKRLSLRQEMGAADKFVIATVGRPCEQKNPLFAMDVFAQVAKHHPTAEYWWIGSGPMGEELAAYVEKKGLKGRVRLLGSRDDVMDLYQAMDCFFLPSRFEGLGIVNIEAQAYGLPCVVSDAVPRMVDYSGLVRFLPLDAGVETWAEALMAADQPRTGMEKYGEMLRNSVFSHEHAGETLLNAYERALGKQPRA